MEPKKRKLLVVDVEEEKKALGPTLHDQIIKETQKLAQNKGNINYGEDLWDVMDALYKTTDEKQALALAERARLMVAGARSAKAAEKLEKLGEFLQDRGVSSQDPSLVEKGDKLLEKAQQMKDSQETAVARPVQSPAAKKERPPKKPVFNDPEKQKEVKLKYPWVIEGTFRQDPQKAGGTNVDIKCQKCGGSRTVHLADAFQVKLCVKCRQAKKK